MRGRPITGADPLSFRGVGGDYAVDAQQAYHRGQAIQSAVAQGFASLGVALATDGQSYYLGTTALSAPPDPHWLTLTFEALQTLLATQALLKRTAAGDVKAMAKMADLMLHNEAGEDGFRALRWARLARLFGSRRLTRLENDANFLLDPHDEVVEIHAEISYEVAATLWDGLDVPRRPQEARKQLARAFREGLPRPIEEVITKFGLKEVEAAQQIAKNAVAPKKKSSKWNQ